MTGARGGAVTYSPVLDVVRDPRWGRTEECFGEDPYLIGEFAVAAVEGLQGERLDGENSVAVTLKHFAGYGSSEDGRNAGPVHMGRRELLEVDLYPFRRAVEAGAASVMPAYNEIDGVPCTVNEELLDGVRPRYPFAFGLSYTEFEYSRLTVEPAVMTADETATVTVDVTNVGSRAGSEVVQLYITDAASLCTRPLKELKGFRKIGLAPGETRTVRFEVGREQLQYIGRDYRPTVEPGLFRITVGRHAEDDGLTADLVVEEAARTQP